MNKSFLSQFHHLTIWLIKLGTNKMCHRVWLNSKILLSINPNSNIEFQAKKLNPLKDNTIFLNITILKEKI